MQSLFHKSNRRGNSRLHDGFGAMPADFWRTGHSCKSDVTRQHSPRCMIEATMFQRVLRWIVRLATLSCCALGSDQDADP
jgi:hypothetical protein